MAFLVYFFVLLVAAASVVFGLDWTQAPLNPPPYATVPAQTAAVAPEPAPKAVGVKPAAHSVAVAKTTEKPSAKTADSVQASVPAAPVAAVDPATQAQASATPADTTGATPVAAASCNVSACSSAYRSFRASDCTYQPMSGERRLCTKSGSAGKVAAAAHPRSTHRAEPRDDYRDRRYSDRRDSYYDRRDAYDGDRRGGWGLGGLFGGGDY
jgi:hypothetical protein